MCLGDLDCWVGCPGWVKLKLWIDRPRLVRVVFSWRDWVMYIGVLFARK